MAVGTVYSFEEFSAQLKDAGARATLLERAGVRPMADAEVDAVLADPVAAQGLYRQVDGALYLGLARGQVSADKRGDRWIRRGFYALVIVAGVGFYVFARSSGWF